MSNSSTLTLSQQDIDRIIQISKQLDSLRKKYTAVTGVYAAFTALARAKTTDTPEQTLRNLQTFYDAMLRFIPSNPVFSEFLKTYSQIIGVVATAMGKLCSQIQAAARGAGILLHPGAYEGGYAVYAYMIGAEKNVTADLGRWVYSSRCNLGLITGSMPPDRNDLAKLKTWLDTYRKEICLYVYGTTNLPKDGVASYRR